MKKNCNFYGYQQKEAGGVAPLDFHANVLFNVSTRFVKTSPLTNYLVLC